MLEISFSSGIRTRVCKVRFHPFLPKSNHIQKCFHVVTSWVARAGGCDFAVEGEQRLAPDPEAAVVTLAGEVPSTDRHSPKLIHTKPEPDDFMLLVQKLTGSSDTRLRLTKSSASKGEKHSAGVETIHSI